MEHIHKTIETFEAKIAEHEQEIFKLRAAVNHICAVAGLEPKYQLDDGGVGALGITTTGKLPPIKPDEFFNKSLSSSVKQALIMLRATGKAPASIETIYDVLASGGYAFEQKARDAGIQGLSISVGKNSALFVKLPSGLIGLKEWYGEGTRGRRGKDTNGSKPTDDEIENTTAESAPSQGSSNNIEGESA